MPLYEYLCEKCGKTTEVIQSFLDEPIKSCPHCRSRRIRKLISSPAIQFKGTGWYVTDYAGKRPSPSEGGSSDTGAPGGGKTEKGARAPRKGGPKRSGE